VGLGFGTGTADFGGWKLPLQWEGDVLIQSKVTPDYPVAGGGSVAASVRLAGRSARNSGFNLVRWILVVTLGCSLGLLVVLMGLSLRSLTHKDADTDEPLAEMHFKGRPETPFEVSDDAIQAELRAVIESQLSAFREDDYPKAYTFAGAGLKTKMPLPVFERMIKTSYLFLAKSRSAQYGAILDNGEQAVVNVGIMGATGHVRHYRYILQREGGDWKVYGASEIAYAGMTI
jgi:hypothetical protein